MKILYKFGKQIQKNKLTRFVGIVTVGVGIRNVIVETPDPSIPSNPSEQIERIESSFKRDTEAINTNAILIKSGNGILISDSRTSKNLNKFDSEQIILVKTGDSGPSSPPVNSISRGGFVNSDPSKNSKPSNSDCKVPFRAAPGGSGDSGNGGGASWDDDVLEENKVPEQSKWKDDWRRYNPSFSQPKEKPEQCLDENVDSEIKQNKGGNDELPDSPNYKYNLKTKTAWENKIARKSILSALESMDKGELLPRNQKNFESYKELKLKLIFNKFQFLLTVLSKTYNHPKTSPTFLDHASFVRKFASCQICLVVLLGPDLACKNRFR